MFGFATSYFAGSISCFCFSHSHVNHFTGTVYQSVLLSQKQPLKAISMDESVQPNTSPAQWPGKSIKRNFSHRSIFWLFSVNKNSKQVFTSSPFLFVTRCNKSCYRYAVLFLRPTNMSYVTHMVMF